MSIVGDIMSTPGDIMRKVIGKTTEFVWKTQCAEHSPDVLNDIPWCTQ